GSSAKNVNPSVNNKCFSSFMLKTPAITWLIEINRLRPSVETAFSLTPVSSKKANKKSLTFARTFCLYKQVQYYTDTSCE
ncbi:hypothetical protein, partial [Enterococcus faecalis]|uniref:hypothetical protein n=1 Tax=Enterococcus faecalis TaxID=1351 RepID=UPI001C634E22